MAERSPESDRIITETAQYLVGLTNKNGGKVEVVSDIVHACSLYIAGMLLTMGAGIEEGISLLIYDYVGLRTSADKAASAPPPTPKTSPGYL